MEKFFSLQEQFLASVFTKERYLTNQKIYF